MVPYLQERFHAPRWEMELFWLPKRIRNKGQEEPVFHTFDWTEFGNSPVVQKYIQTYIDYIWWVRLRLQKPYELIHSHHPIAAMAMKTVFPDTPLIHTVHSSFERELILNGRITPDGLEHRFLVSLYRELEYISDQLLTVSRSFAEYMSPYVETPEAIGIMRNGFDEKRFKPVPHENDIPQLITVCRLVPAKGLDILLKACSDLKSKGYDFVLHIIGDGPSRQELETMARELDIYQETIFYGYTLHPEEFMPFFDIFVLPSRAEAFGSVFAEAALSCLALVGTDVGGIAEQIDDGKNGLLVPPEDPVALSEALEKVIADPQYRYELARSASDKAKDQYSLTKAVHELKKMYLKYQKQERG